MTRRRLAPEHRRAQLIDVAAKMFAAQSYDQVSMDAVAQRSGVTRALVYRHFPRKRDLFVAVYRQAADRLLTSVQFDPDVPLEKQISVGLDAHFDYFEANRHTVLAANRALADDAAVQAIIRDELGVLRDRAVNAITTDIPNRQQISAVLLSWLAFVRVLSVEWLTDATLDRSQVHDISVAALGAALHPLIDLDGGTNSPALTRSGRAQPS